MPLKPTVAHVKDHFLPRSETFIYTLLQAHRRYRPIVLDRHPRVHAAQFPWEAYYSPAETWGPWAGIAERALLRWWGRSPYLERVLRRTQTRIMHVHFGQVATLFAPLAQRLHLPLVTSFYGKDVSVFGRHPAWRSRFRTLWAYGDAFLVLGPHMAQQIIEQGCPEDKVHILPLALDLHRIPFTSRVPPPKGSPTRLLTVGRLIPKKGIDVLLRALAQLPPHVHLWIVGDGPQRAELDHLARTLGVSHRVTFLGWQSHEEVIAWMQRAHIFVLPSRTDPTSGETEGTPTVILEAQASGLPVVATRHADIPSLVEEGRSGFLVAEGDAEGLAQALKVLCAHPDRWRAMGRAGRERVETHHHVERVIQRLESIYDATIRHFERRTWQK